MIRLRLILCALACITATIVAVLALLVVGAAEERSELDHRIVAERVFEECERQLNLLVQREDDRPFTHYRYFMVPDGLLPGNEALARSPLAQPPQDAWNRGYFQIDPDGTVSNPATPIDLRLAQNSFQWRPDPAADAATCTVNDWALGNRRELGLQENELRPFLGCFEVGRQPGPAALEPLAAVAQPATEPDGSTALIPVQVSPVQVQVGSDPEALPVRTGADPVPVADAGPDAPPSPTRDLPPPPAPVDLAQLRQERQVLQAERWTSSPEAPEANSEPVVVYDQAQLARNQERRQSKSKLALELSLGGAYLERKTSSKTLSIPASQAYGYTNAGDNYLSSQALQRVASANSFNGSFPVQSDTGNAPEVVLETGLVLPHPLVEDPAPSTADSALLGEEGQLQVFEWAEDPRGAMATRRYRSPPVEPPEQPAGPAVSLLREGEAEQIQQAATTASQAPSSVTSPAPAAEPLAAAPTTEPPAAAAATPHQSPADPAAQQESGLDDFYSDIVRTLGVAPDARLGITVHPLRGHDLGDGRGRVLVRQVELDGQRFLQGLMIDLPALSRRIGGQVLAGSGLEGVSDLRWQFDGSLPDGPVADDGRYHFVHRFDEPFTNLVLDLALEPLPDKQRSHTLLLVLIGSGGLALVLGFWALARMVATRIEFAQRRSDFVSAVSHELRTPLTSIRMYGEMLREGMVTDQEQRQRYYGTITAEGERLSRLVDNVLELARIERGDARLDLRVGAVSEILDEVRGILEPHIVAQGFSLELDCGTDLPAVRCDRDALVQALLNLIDNGLKFAASAERKVIRIAAERSGPAVRIRVRDFGPGVPQPHLAKLCEPFFRGERELTRRTKGTGIGLALVRGLIQRMGGRFTVRNHPEGGFEACLELASA